MARFPVIKITSIDLVQIGVPFNQPFLKHSLEENLDMPKIVNVNIFYIWIKHPQSIHLYASHRVVLFVRNNIPRFSFLPVWFITFLYISQTIPMVHKVPNKNNYKLDLQCSIHKLSRCTGSVIYSIWTPASIRTTSNEERINFQWCSPSEH